MKRLLLTLTGAMLVAAPLLAATDDEISARRRAGDVAGAFGNDGFKLRDGSWSGTFETGKAKVIQVNLYAGNQYWFTLGAAASAKKVKVSVYDETGKLMESDPYQDVSVAAAGFAAQTSGSYYIKIEELEGGSSAFCLLYSYK